MLILRATAQEYLEFILSVRDSRASELAMAEAGANASLGRGGYDEEFVSAIEDEWECPVCQLPLKAAVQTGICGHRFCRQCLDEHFTR